jgi:hypothetical protein
MMRTFAKDVLKVCKGHCSDEYKTTFDAVKAYQAEHTGSSIEHLSDETVLRFMYRVVDELFTLFDYKELIRDRLMRDYSFKDMRGFSFEFSYRYVAELFMRQIQSMRVRNDDGSWIIDLSDYEDGEQLI